MEAGAQVRVPGTAGLVFEVGDHGVFGRHCAAQAATAVAGDLAFELCLGLGHQGGGDVATGVVHLGFHFQVPVRVCGYAGGAAGFGTGIQVDDAGFARLNVFQLGAEHGESGRAVTV